MRNVRARFLFELLKVLNISKKEIRGEKYIP